MSILLGLLIGAPLASALLWRTATLGSHSFWELFAYQPVVSAFWTSRAISARFRGYQNHQVPGYIVN